MSRSSKLERLEQVIGSYGSVLVAYSGGVDSVLLAYTAQRVLGDRALAVIADSPSLARSELAEAVQLGKDFDFAVRVIRTQEFSNTDYTENPINRCYYCKHELFSHLRPIAEKEKFGVIAYGENISDLGDYRPGAQAAMEFEVRAPLKEAQLTKDEIRAVSRELGLPTSEKPQMACLSSRIPYGEEVTPAKTSMIERAELLIREAGFYDVRVRHHENNGEALARIEVDPDRVGTFFENNLQSRLEKQLKEVGYRYVTVDLGGYRRGSLNSALALGGATGVPL